MRSNVRRALNRKACLDFDAQEKALKSAMTKNDVPAEVPLTSNNRPENTLGQRQSGQLSNHQKQGAKAQPPKKRSDARFNGLPLCFAYNSKGRTCTNQTSATGCSPKTGVDYLRPPLLEVGIFKERLLLRIPPGGEAPLTAVNFSCLLGKFFVFMYIAYFFIHNNMPISFPI